LPGRRRRAIRASAPVAPALVERPLIAGFGCRPVVLGQQQIAFDTVDLRLDIALARFRGQVRRFAPGGQAFIMAATGSQSLRQQDQVVGALEACAGRAIRGHADAAHRIDHARKLGEQLVASGFDDPPTVLGNLRAEP
jgi:hypothetical protein